MTEQYEMPPMVEVTVICRNESCVNDGIPITFKVPMGSPVYCGPCGMLLPVVTQ